jgi:hypothetical protein
MATSVSDFVSVIKEGDTVEHKIREMGAIDHSLRQCLVGAVFVMIVGIIVGFQGAEGDVGMATVGLSAGFVGLSQEGGGILTARDGLYGLGPQKVVIGIEDLGVLGFDSLVKHIEGWLERF